MKILHSLLVLRTTKGRLLLRSTSIILLPWSVPFVLRAMGLEVSSLLNTTLEIILWLLLFFWIVKTIEEIWTDFLRPLYLSYRNSNVSKPKFKKPPGSLLLKFSGLFNAKYRRKLLEEISDMRIEYYEALSDKNITEANRIVARYYLGIAWSTLIWIANRIKDVFKFSN